MKRLASRATRTALTLGLLSSSQASARSLSLTPIDSHPAALKSAGNIESFRRALVDSPDDRRVRFELVRALVRAGTFDEALVAAREWRERDAYNLVVVRLIGDIHMELGNIEEAMRAYSAVVELVPKDHTAQRALASVLKQGNKLDAALLRLRAALKLRPDDARLRFETADVLHRTGKEDEARAIFEEIVSDASAPELLSYPAKERLAQIYKGLRRQAIRSNKRSEAKMLESKLQSLSLRGKTENDIKVYLTWDTDRSDVDLWIVNPKGEKIFYSHKKGEFGGQLFGDVTSGYGPESFTAEAAASGTYQIRVNYFRPGSSNFPEARGEVTVVLNEGRANETRTVLPYRLFSSKQTVTVAEVKVSR